MIIHLFITLNAGLATFVGEWSPISVYRSILLLHDKILWPIGNQFSEMGEI